MLHLCLFGGHGGQLSNERRIYLTMFGGCDLRWPTLAKQLIEFIQRGTGQPRPFGHVFITLFGGTDITAPTLAQEYLDLQSALRSGQVSLADWDRNIVRLGDSAQRGASLTLFGGYSGDELPSEDQELDELALNRHLGYLNDETSELLMRGVGQRGSSRAAVVRQAVATALAGSRGSDAPSPQVH